MDEDEDEEEGEEEENEEKRKKRKSKMMRKTAACKILEHLHILASLVLCFFFLENASFCTCGAERRTSVKF